MPARTDLASRHERGERLHTSLAVAIKLKPLLDDDVAELLDGEEAALVEIMVNAPDDDTRRTAAQEIRAWRRLRAIIASAVSHEGFAARKIQEMTHAN